MLTCREVTEMASDYLDGNLGFAQRLQIRFHLGMCRHCSRYVDQLAKTINLLREGQVTAPASEVEEQLVALLRASKS